MPCNASCRLVFSYAVVHQSIHAGGGVDLDLVRSRGPRPLPLGYCSGLELGIKKFRQVAVIDALEGRDHIDRGLQSLAGKTENVEKRIARMNSVAYARSAEVIFGLK